MRPRVHLCAAENDRHRWRRARRHLDAVEEFEVHRKPFEYPVERLRAGTARLGVNDRLWDPRRLVLIARALRSIHRTVFRYFQPLGIGVAPSRQPSDQYLTYREPFGRLERLYTCEQFSTLE